MAETELIISRHFQVQKLGMASITKAHNSNAHNEKKDFPSGLYTRVCMGNQKPLNNTGKFLGRQRFTTCCRRTRLSGQVGLGDCGRISH